MRLSLKGGLARGEAGHIGMAAAQIGVRNPVQVIEGNYTKMPGVCPWFDAVSNISSRKAG